jgi:hypothetical protein
MNAAFNPQGDMGKLSAAGSTRVQGLVDLIRNALPDPLQRFDRDQGSPVLPWIKPC